MKRTFRGVAASSLVGLLLLTGCGAGASSSTAGSSTSGGAPESGDYTPAQMHDLLACLRSAGFHHVRPAEATGGSPAAGTSTPDAGGPIRFPPGMRFSDAKLAKALHICRITLPSVAPGS
jgi:hypothetical protein